MDMRKVIEGLEYRNYELSGIVVEERAEGKPGKIQGHAAVFNQLSVPLDGGWYKERINPGAFAKTIKEDDIRALWNHDDNWVLGRNKSGTLSLKEDDKGLFVVIEPPDTTWAADLSKTIKRKDVDQMSFGFNVIGEHWVKENNWNIRILDEVKLWDVSPVTYPAYPQTDVAIRSMLEQAGIDPNKLGDAVKDKNDALIRSFIEVLSAMVTPDQEVRGASLDILKRRLDLMEVLMK